MTQKTQEQDIAIGLKALGFSERETALYLLLLELGEVTAGPLVAHSGFHRQLVYDALAALEARGMVRRRVSRGRQHFRVGDAARLVDEAEARTRTAKEVARTVKETASARAFQQDVRLYEGVAGLREMHLTNIAVQPKHSTFNIIGAGGERWFTDMQEDGSLDRYERMRLARNVSTRFVTFESKRREVESIIKRDERQGPGFGKQYRFLPESHANPVVTQVWHDRVATIIYGAPIVIMEVRNPAVVESMNQYFTALWKVARP